jgi:DNA replication protein DnaC
MRSSPRRCSRPKPTAATATAANPASRPRASPPQTLEEFDFAFQSSIPRDTVLHLGQLDFLAGRENVVLLGPPGRGSQCTFLLRE